jgi:hypothetical protein
MDTVRVAAVHIGFAKDALGFRCSVMEDPSTGKRYLGYAPEDWWLRERHIKTLQALGKEVPQDRADRLSIETE